MTIKINVGLIQQLVPQFTHESNRLRESKHHIKQISSSIDSRVLSRNGIGSRLNQLSHDITEIELKLKQIESVIKLSMGSYLKTEMMINKKAGALDSVASKKKMSKNMKLAYEAFKGGRILLSEIESSFNFNERLKSGEKTIDNAWEDLTDSVYEEIDNRMNDTYSNIDNKRRKMIEAFTFVEKNKKDIFNLLLENGVRGTLDMTPGGRVFRMSYEYAHYELRDSLNGKHPTFEEVESKNSEWILLEPEMSIYHDDGKGARELKYIHPDGREAVFYGGTFEPMMDPRYKGTYNYISPTLMPNGAPDNLSELVDWFEFFTMGAGHVITDVVPYYLVGEKNSRDQRRFDK